MPQSLELVNSQYGKYLAGRLDLQLLSRRPIEWRQKHIEIARHAKAEPTQNGAGSVEDGEKTKRRRKDKDEIDELFAKKSKVAA